MANGTVTVTVQASEVSVLINNLQRVVQVEEQASRGITININTGQLDSAARSFERMSSAAQNIATIMRGAGTAFNAAGSFASGVGNSFSSMSSLFGNSNVSTAITRFITYNVLRGITGNLSSITQRYDIMSTFLPYMNVAGVSNFGAQNALDRVNQAILGLPIGLDEAAQRLRRYQMFMNDIKGATDLTIGVQNAILAGGASSSMQSMAYMQIDRLRSAGRLNQSRQWLSLIQGLGVSMRFISEQMGTTGMSAKDLAAGLTSGKISTEQFLDALKALGRGESDAAQGLEATLDIYKGTIEAWVNNINFAFARGGEKVLKSLNQTLIGTTGQGITGFMKDYRDFLDTAFTGTADWINGNPDLFLNVFDKASNLIDSISRFSASDMGSAVFNNIGRLFDGIATALNSIPDGKLEEFAAFATTLAGPLGAGFSASSGLGVMLGVFERFKDFPFDTLVQDISDATSLMANIVNGALNFGPLGNNETMSNLLAYGLVFGKPIGSILTGAGSAITSIASLAMLRRIAQGVGGTGTGAAGAGLFEIYKTVFGGMMTGYNAAFPSTVLAALMLGTLGQANARNGQYLAQSLGLTGINVGAERVNAVMQNAQLLYGTNVTPGNAATTAAGLRSSMRDLNSEYVKQAVNLQQLQEMRAKAVADYERINRQLNSMGVDAEEGLTADDLNTYNNYAEIIGEIDEEIASTEANMAALNVQHDLQYEKLDGVTKRYGKLASGIDEATESAEKFYNAEGKVAAMWEEQIPLERLEEYAKQQESFASAVAAQASMFKEIEPLLNENKGVFGVSDATSTQRKNNELTTNYLANVDNILTYLEEHRADPNSQSLAGLLNYLLGEEDIGETAEIIKQISDDLSDGKLETALELVQQYQEKLNLVGQAGQARENAQYMEENIKQYKEWKEAHQDLLDHPEQFAQFDFLDSGARIFLDTAVPNFIESLGEGQEAIVDAINHYYENINPPEILKGADGSALFDALDPQGFTEKYAASKISEIMQTVQTDFQGVANAITASAAAIPESLAEIASSMGEGMDETAEKSTEGAEEVVKPIQEMPNTIRAQAQPAQAAVEWIGAAIASGFVTATQDATNGAANGIAAIQQAIADIQAAASAVTISIPVTYTVNDGGGLPSGLDGSSGVVIAATGGSIFSPIGSDIVPAMLTPGEYIIRKGAVDYFGKGLFERINSLDIGGAFDRLMLSPPMMSRFGDNVYNRDSHNNVTQNVYTNNPNFANKRAWRFAL